MSAVAKYKSPCLENSEGRCCRTFRFNDLVFDLQVYIISYFVPPQDLKTLSLVSHHMKSLAIPALYHEVRLLFGLRPSTPGNHKTARAYTDTLVSAQQDFTFQFLTHLERTRYVRALAWQFCVNSGSTFTGLFPLLYNLSTVHLINPYPTHLKDLNIVLPPLFPRIKHIRITGTTAMSLILPIFHSPQHLVSLSLDIIQPHTTALQLLDWVRSTDLPCLMSLSLRALAQRTQRWDLSRENELLLAWREALLSVRISVGKITLGLRTAHLPPPGSLPVSPSAERFAQMVLPVFLERSWPKLETLKFEGIPIDTIAPKDHAARLRSTVPKVVVDPEINTAPRFWTSESRDIF